MKLTIDHELQQILPSFNVIAYTMDVINDSTNEVDNLLRTTEKTLSTFCTLDEVCNIKKIKEGRDAYKKLGKDPSRYRLAVEALLRRCIRKLELYRINDLVDLGNILSLITLRSVCVVDSDKIINNIVIRKATDSDHYEAIHRGILNIANIPVYCDDIGPFGSPTSDTDRTSITNKTKSILVMIIQFNNEDPNQDEEHLINLFTTYAKATNLNKIEVSIDE